MYRMSMNLWGAATGNGETNESASQKWQRENLEWQRYEQRELQERQMREQKDRELQQQYEMYKAQEDARRIERERQEYERRMRRETRRLGPSPGAAIMQQQQQMSQSQSQRQQGTELRSLFPFQARNQEELSFGPGERLIGLQLVDNGTWWYGENPSTRQRGMFPARFVENPMDAARKAAPESDGKSGRSKPAKDEESASRVPLTLFAHNLANCGAGLSIFFAAISAFWDFERQNPNNSPQKLQQLLVVLPIWIYAFAIGPPIFIYEYIYGLQRQLSYSRYVSPRGLAYFTLSLPLYVGYPTMLAAGTLTAASIVNIIADYRGEAGKHLTAKGESFIKLPGRTFLSFWFILYFLANVAVTVHATFRFIDIIGAARATCIGITDVCPSNWAIPAKVAGQLLNFNCTLILLPVMKGVLRSANNAQVCGGKLLSQYIPLRKNIVFHKYIAFMIFVATFVHILTHYVNFGITPEITLATFGRNAWVTGAALTFVMIIMYCGAQNRVKRANFEVFWTSHHFFIFFFLLIVAHGPDFWMFSGVAVVMYLFDRIWRALKGTQAFYLRRVLYIPPIMELSFYPKGNWTFREGQYLYLNAPHLSANEWHPFTISSAFGDLENAERKEITLHIKVQGFKSWTRKLMQYFSSMASDDNKKGDAFVVELSHYNEQGKAVPGKYLGPDGKPLIQIDGPHAAPAQVYSGYNEVMLIGAGIGLTPTSSILKAICRYKWKKGFSPQVVYFYWVVRHDEIESFRWFVNVLYELEKRVASDRQAGALSADHRIELNVYVTAAPKPGGAPVEPKQSSGLKFTSAQDMGVGYNVDVGFTEDMLMKALLNPQSPSEQQKSIQMRESRDIWIWNGRPKWDDIFQSVKEKRNSKTRSIAACFCGTPVIGKDLKINCSKASSLSQGIKFDLYKENF